MMASKMISIRKERFEKKHDFEFIRTIKFTVRTKGAQVDRILKIVEKR